MPRKLYIDINKVISEVEMQQAPIKPTILPLVDKAMLYGQTLLYKYADVHAFGSHDALIAGVVMDQKDRGHELTLVTSDRGLKAVCNKVGISLLDPQIDI
jgi:hypothetical protein